jgi:hypothetical protein
MIDVALIHRPFGSDRSDNLVYTDLCAIGGVVSIDANRSMGKSIGTMNITLAAKQDYKSFFTQNDSIDLYVSYSKLDRSSYVNMNTNNLSSFVFSGSVGSVITAFNEGKEVIDITCADKVVVLTNINAKRTSYSNLSTTPTYIYRKSTISGVDQTQTDIDQSALNNLISEVNEDMATSYAETNPTNGNYWKNIVISNTSDDASDLSAYTRLNAGFPFKTYAEIFNDFAYGTYTNKTQYTYWIDASDVFYWKKLTNNKDDDMIYGTDRIKSIKFNEEVYDTVTASIVNAGVDLNGTGIWWYVYNSAFATQLGLRWDIYTNTMSGKDFRRLDAAVTSGTATSVSGKVLTDTSQSWTTNAFAGMYLINPAPPNSFLIVSNTANTITVTGEGLKAAEYTVYDGTNADFRANVRDIAVAEAEARLAKTAKLRYKGTVVLEGTNTHYVNEVFDVVQDYFGFTLTSPKRMRLSDIAHNIADGSWETTLTFKEDVGTEGAQ